MPTELSRFLVALQFLTRVPVRLARFEPAWLTESVRWFPLVGALVGSWGAAAACAAGLLWPLPVAVMASMAATVWLTGGFHEDGLADTCDGLGGSVPRERALEIMKDSRVGSYALLGIVLVLGLKAAALWAVGQGAMQALPLLSLGDAGAVAGWQQAAAGRVAVALVLGHGVSRAAPVLLLAWLPYAGDAAHAKAKPLAQQVDGPGMAVALLTAAVLLLAAGLLPGSPFLHDAAHLLAAALAPLGVAVVCARWLRRRLGGFTGDTLGATQQYAELAVYLALAARLGG